MAGDFRACLHVVFAGQAIAERKERLSILKQKQIF